MSMESLSALSFGFSAFSFDFFQLSPTLLLIKKSKNHLSNRVNLEISLRFN
jgi:hypothetical protein